MDITWWQHVESNRPCNHRCKQKRHGRGCQNNARFELRFRSFLAKTVIKQKLIRIHNNAVKQKKWNQCNLQNTAKLNQYTSCLCNKLIGKKVQQDNKEEWKNIKDTIIVSANEVIQTQNTSNRSEWWDDSGKLIMTQKN